MILLLLVLLLAALTLYVGVCYRIVQVLAWMDTQDFRDGNHAQRPAFVKMVRDTSHDHVQATTEGFLHSHCEWSFPWTFTCYFHNPGHPLG